MWALMESEAAKVRPCPTIGCIWAFLQEPNRGERSDCRGLRDRWVVRADSLVGGTRISTHRGLPGTIPYLEESLLTYPTL